MLPEEHISYILSRFKSESKEMREKKKIAQWSEITTFSMVPMVFLHQEVGEGNSSVFAKCFSDCSLPASVEHSRNASQFQCRRGGAGVAGPTHW